MSGVKRNPTPVNSLERPAYSGVVKKNKFFLRDSVETPVIATKAVSKTSRVCKWTILWGGLAVDKDKSKYLTISQE